MRFRKKPVEVDAKPFDGSYESACAIREWSNGKVSIDNGNGTLSVKTLEGVMVANPQDWIICGVKGEFYPCKPEIFLASYEPVGHGGE